MLSYVDNNILDEEFVPFYDYYRSKKPDFGYQLYDVFDLQNMNATDCKAEFRVEKADLPRLAYSSPYIFMQCSIANRKAFVMVWRERVCC